MSDLLPANSTPAERAFSLATDRLSQIDAPADLTWDPDRIPAAFLPWLAWALSVDHWEPDWSEAKMREVVGTAVARHRIKGTRLSVEQALAEIGYADAIVIEDRDLPRYSAGPTGPWTYGKTWTYLSGPSWADYSVIVTVPITAIEAERIADRLWLTAPARCRLRDIRLSEQFYTYSDGPTGPWTFGKSVTYGGIYRFGA